LDLGKADKMKMTYEQAVSYLYEIPKFTKKNGLEHTKELLRRLDIREENFKIIHVAGSNGKGSVCRAISEVLTENQKRIVYFTTFSKNGRAFLYQWKNVLCGGIFRGISLCL